MNGCVQVQSVLYKRGNETLVKWQIVGMNVKQVDQCLTISASELLI